MRPIVAQPAMAVNVARIAISLTVYSVVVRGAAAAAVVPLQLRDAALPPSALGTIWYAVGTPPIRFNRWLKP
jgi:hypothetical protein